MHRTVKEPPRFRFDGAQENVVAAAAWATGVGKAHRRLHATAHARSSREAADRQADVGYGHSDRRIGRRWLHRAQALRSIGCMNAAESFAVLPDAVRRALRPSRHHSGDGAQSPPSRPPLPPARPPSPSRPSPDRTPEPMRDPPHREAPKPERDSSCPRSARRIVMNEKTASVRGEAEGECDQGQISTESSVLMSYQ